MALTSFNASVESAEPITAIEADFHQWAFDTAAAIERRQFANVDWNSVSEELRSLGKSEERELESCLSQLMYHLLKTQYQPERNSRSWQLSSRNQQRRIVRLLGEQPSLKSKLADQTFWAGAYEEAKALSDRDNLPDSVVDQFPEECPFSADILL